MAWNHSAVQRQLCSKLNLKVAEDLPCVFAGVVLKNKKVMSSSFQILAQHKIHKKIPLSGWIKLLWAYLAPTTLQWDVAQSPWIQETTQGTDVSRPVWWWQHCQKSFFCWPLQKPWQRRAAPPRCHETSVACVAYSGQSSGQGSLAINETFNCHQSMETQDTAPPHRSKHQQI